MVKLSELINNTTTQIELSYWIILTIKKSLTVNEQMWLWLAELTDLSSEERAKRIPEVVYKLVTDWNVEDDNGEKLEITLENFKNLPISFPEINDILMSCDSFKQNPEKKNIDEN